MTTSPEAVNILVLGGLTHLARPLLHHLIKLEASPKIKHIRVVDKYLVDGQASTTYIDSDTLEALQDPRVQYRQANLNIATTASSCFELPDDQTFDVVFDITGEGILGSDVPSQLLLERTTKLAGLLAAEAEKHKVRAYIRDTPCFWTSKPDEGPWKESGITKRSLARGVRPYFYYEAERAVANVEGLPVVILRSAAIYGPHQYHGLINPRIALGEVYRHLNEPMKMLWSADLKVNTLHTRDWCRAAWEAALWCLKRNRSEANAEAGEDLPRVTPKDKAKYGGLDVEQDVDRCCPRSKSVKAPIFNVVDEGNTDQGTLLKVLGQIFDIDTGFTNAAINTWAKLNLGSVVDDINEKHADAMNTLFNQSDPPITDTPITCYLNTEDLGQRSVHLDGSKIKHVLNWQPKEVYSRESVKEIIESFKKNGTWVCR